MPLERQSGRLKNCRRIFRRSETFAKLPKNPLKSHQDIWEISHEHLLPTNRPSHDCQTQRPLPIAKVGPGDWQPIKQYLNRQRTRYLRDHRGRPAYPLLSMFKAVLLGQWHSLSDPELEHSLITRIDFNLFCRFDELSIPDYSTLCRYRNWRRKTTPCPNCCN